MSYLKRSGELHAGELFIAGILPLTVIVFTLAVLNLEGAVFEIMAGINRNRTTNDAAYQWIILLALVSQLLIIPLLIVYVVLIALKRSKQKERNANNSQPQQE